jgi:hypothetical protein
VEEEVVVVVVPGRVWTGRDWLPVVVVVVDPLDEEIGLDWEDPEVVVVVVDPGLVWTGLDWVDPEVVVVVVDP